MAWPEKRKYILLVFFAASFLYPIKSYSAEQAETARLLRTMTPPLSVIEDRIGKKDEWYVEAFYEPSDIIQGTRTGHWNELTTLLGYIHRNVRGYFSVSQLERFDNKDYTANFGNYFSFKDYYIHTELGFGWMVDYIYEFQSIAEYGHRLYRELYWQLGYTYRNYTVDDTHMVYPGLIYYFGDSYISGNYGVSFMEAHDTATFGTVRGNFAITKFLQWYCGVAVGERLYDIYNLEAHEEFGYILFTGVNINLYKGISFRGGYSYGTENPKFIKRSLNFGLSAKF